MTKPAEPHGGLGERHHSLPATPMPEATSSSVQQPRTKVQLDSKKKKKTSTRKQAKS